VKSRWCCNDFELVACDLDNGIERQRRCIHFCAIDEHAALARATQLQSRTVTGDRCVLCINALAQQLHIGVGRTADNDSLAGKLRIVSFDDAIAAGAEFA
jgi:hypothetical protein